MPKYDHDAIYKAYPDAVAIDDSNVLLNYELSQITIVQSDVDAARVELNKLNYKYDRVGITSGYAPIEDQLDQLYHDINAGKFGADAKTGEWFVGVSSVKTLYPKP